MIRSARSIGVSVVGWYESVEDAGGVVRAQAETSGAAVIHLRRFLPDQVIAELNCAATAVLANSRHEPFGLVGLEAMAAGGGALVGATGGGDARPDGHAIAVGTEEPSAGARAPRGPV